MDGFMKCVLHWTYNGNWFLLNTLVNSVNLLIIFLVKRLQLTLFLLSGSISSCRTVNRLQNCRSSFCIQVTMRSLEPSLKLWNGIMLKVRCLLQLSILNSSKELLLLQRNSVSLMTMNISLKLMLIHQ